MSNELFAAALGVEKPWYVKDVSFDAGKRLLTIAIDFKKGSRFPYAGSEGAHPGETLPPSQLLPARMLSRSAHAQDQATRWPGGSD
jgi:hypothetical protein